VPDFQEIHLTQEQAEALLSEWQEILRLQDWDVIVRIVRGNGLNLPEDIQGTCKYILKRHQAVIKLLNPVDWDPDIPWPQDMETTLVHELLHLHFGPFDKFEEDDARDVASEQAIHAISSALTRVKRLAISK
jgi:hypothetical protein